MQANVQDFWSCGMLWVLPTQGIWVYKYSLPVMRVEYMISWKWRRNEKHLPWLLWCKGKRTKKKMSMRDGKRLSIPSRSLVLYCVCYTRAYIIPLPDYSNVDVLVLAWAKRGRANVHNSWGNTLSDLISMLIFPSVSITFSFQPIYRVVKLHPSIQHGRSLTIMGLESLTDDLKNTFEFLLFV